MTDHDKEPFVRTLKAISERYNEQRNKIITNIKKGKVSASMSGIEYFPKAWEDLDVNDPVDLLIINTSLTWDGHDHTHEGLRKFLPKELDLRHQLSELMYEPCGPERNRKADAFYQRIIDAHPIGKLNQS